MRNHRDSSTDQVSDRAGPTAAALAWVLSFGLLAGCSSAPPVEEVPSAETYYNRGLELLKGSRVLLFLTDVDYPRAIELFQEVIDNYPYSEYATLAELKIADVHFDQQNYEEAQGYYQDFVELHPNHEKAAYAIYRNGLCSFRRIRDPDQDQVPVREATEQFRVLLERYPDSEHAPPAAQRLQESRDALAQHDIEVADFYFTRGRYHAAATRYRQALMKYPDHSGRLHTLISLGTALKRMHRYDEAEAILRQVLEERPADGLDDDLEAELQELSVDLSTGENGPPF